VIVLYDADCGFCRWAMAWALRHDARHRLETAPIQSPLGSELLADLRPGDRLGSAHVVDENGRRRSGGAAAAQVLGALPRTRALGRLACRAPRTTDLLYRFVAARRASFGKLVGKRARRRADVLLERASARPAERLEPPSRPAGRTAS